MTRCRARMIDGSPVTFEWHDRGPMWQDLDTREFYTKKPEVRVAREVLITEIIGDGFHVLSAMPVLGYNAGNASTDRIEFDRLALERSGVDTVMAERWETELGHNAAPHWRAAFLGEWVPLFPRTAAPGIPITYVGDFDHPESAITEAQDREARELLDNFQATTAIGRDGVIGLRKMVAAYGRQRLQRFTFTAREDGPTSDMLAAGAARLQDRIVLFGMLEKGSFTFSGGLGLTVSDIWRAMEKARR